MNKSYNDIEAQVERVIQMAEHSQFFQGCHRICKTQIRQIGTRAKMQHGIGYFCADKNERKPLKNGVNIVVVHRCRWKELEREMEKWSKAHPRQEAVKKEIKQMPRQEVERRMTEVINAQERNHTLAWIASDMMYKKEMPYLGDIYEVPRFLLSTALEILPHDGKQLRLF